MAAYAAVISLKNTIQRILESSRISLVPPSSETIQLLHNELKPLQEILTRLDSTSKSKSRKKVNALDEEIKEALWKLEDSLESHLSDQILSQFESCGGERDVLSFSIDLQGLRRDVDSFIQTMKDMEEQYIHELENLPEEDDFISSRTDFGGAKSKMVGLSDQFEQAKNALMLRRWNSVYSFVGTAGIGKTTLAKEIYEDPTILNHFECRAWVEVGRKSQFNEIALDILAQVAPNIICREGDHNIADCMRKGLEGKRCLVVLDDVWDEQVLNHLKRCLPEGRNGIIQILVTARDRGVTKNISRSTLGLHVEVVPFLNVKESKELLREKVFGEEDFPRQLENAAEKIAENCEGLPLMLVTVADHLSKGEKTLEYWNEVAEKMNSVFMDAYNAILEVLFPSYNYLPHYLKMFFLYMGVFPQGYKINPTEFTNMLTAEEFLETFETKTEEGIVKECLYDLNFWKNIVITNKKSVNWNMKIDYLIKNFRLHSSWNHLCKEEARRLKFFNALNKLCDALEEGIQGQRRLCLYNNILFGIKEVHDSVKRKCASTAHSLLCTGPYHQYQVPIDVGFKLLGVLHALKLRFYDFPIEILNLVHLQFLALTYNGDLPSSISKLFNLQFLIIHPHMNIKTCRAPSYLPIQIWDMQELKHIEILGSCLPNPNCVDSSLKKLSTLLGVSANSCTREVLSRIPNIRKLGIQIELAPHDDGNPLSCFDHISELKELEILKCSIVNLRAPLTPLSMFPSRLHKLHLTGLGYPWKYMEAIGSLPNLVVLKLRCYAFRGAKWETEVNSFLRLEYLLVEDSDLVQWKPGRGSFPKLHNLSLKHCYKLQELHWPSDCHYGRIELVECNPLAVTCAKKLGELHLGLDVIARSRLDDGDLELENQDKKFRRWKNNILRQIQVVFAILVIFIYIEFKINLWPIISLFTFICLSLK